MALSSKQLRAIELMVYSPHMKQIEIAEELGVHRDTIRRWQNDEEFKEAFSQACKQRFKEAENIAVNAMIKLAYEGNATAAKYMLDSLGYKPTEKIEANIKNDIIINIE
jgi:uncharacterized protein YjcR